MVRGVDMLIEIVVGMAGEIAESGKVEIETVAVIETETEAEVEMVV